MNLIDDKYKLPDPDSVDGVRYIMPIIDNSIIKYIEFKKTSELPTTWRHVRGPARFEQLYTEIK